MPSPFAATAYAIQTSVMAEAQSVTPATDAQIIKIHSLLAERNWRNGGRHYVSRATVLKTVIRWAMRPMAESTPPPISRLINNTVGRREGYGLRVNIIMADMRRGVDNGNHQYYGLLTKQGASRLINALVALPKVKTATKVIDTLEQWTEEQADLPTAEEVPAGRYAVETEDGAVNRLAFYKVDRPTDGRWAGRVFVKLILSEAEDRLSWATSQAVLRKIATVGAEAASARYGHEIGECGVCGRTLTNDESRARGIGPVCARMFG